MILRSGGEAASGEPLLVLGFEGSAGREGALVNCDVALPLGSVLGRAAECGRRLWCWLRGCLESVRRLGAEEPTALEDGEGGDAAAYSLHEAHRVAFIFHCCEGNGGIVGIRVVFEERRHGVKSDADRSKNHGKTCGVSENGVPDRQRDAGLLIACVLVGSPDEDEPREKQVIRNENSDIDGCRADWEEGSYEEADGNGNSESNEVGSFKVEKSGNAHG